MKETMSGCFFSEHSVYSDGIFLEYYNNA